MKEDLDNVNDDRKATWIWKAAKVAVKVAVGLGFLAVVWVATGGYAEWQEDRHPARTVPTLPPSQAPSVTTASTYPADSDAGKLQRRLAQFKARVEDNPRMAVYGADALVDYGLEICSQFDEGGTFDVIAAAVYMSAPEWTVEDARLLVGWSIDAYCPYYAP